MSKILCALSIVNSQYYLCVYILCDTNCYTWYIIPINGVGNSIVTCDPMNVKGVMTILGNVRIFAKCI